MSVGRVETTIHINQRGRRRPGMASSMMSQSPVFRTSAHRAIFLPSPNRWRIFVAKTDLATLSTKFQISIPKAVRTARQWHAGQVFAFIPKGGMLLVPVPRREDLTGLARGAKPGKYRDRTDRT
jgi:bifunctional DNA-binding transcriptional regulator/antitoxin component of YhaV-PrlF toxin-antitoxin module